MLGYMVVATHLMQAIITVALLCAAVRDEWKGIQS